MKADEWTESRLAIHYVLQLEHFLSGCPSGPGHGCQVFVIHHRGSPVAPTDFPAPGNGGPTCGGVMRFVYYVLSPNFFREPIGPWKPVKRAGHLLHNELTAIRRSCLFSFLRRENSEPRAWRQALSPEMTLLRCVFNGRNGVLASGSALSRDVQGMSRLLATCAGLSGVTSLFRRVIVGPTADRWWSAGSRNARCRDEIISFQPQKIRLCLQFTRTHLFFGTAVVALHFLKNISNPGSTHSEPLLATPSS